MYCHRLGLGAGGAGFGLGAGFFGLSFVPIATEQEFLEGDR